ncbi:MAG: O-antigen ligase family protein [Eubacteriales bacterium]|nr:O-antigen ligase family protein [Eubacteriales bacterium]
MKNTITKIVNIYTLILIVVFPLFMINRYYDITEAKLYCYLYSTMAAAVLSLIVCIFCCVKNKNDRKQLAKAMNPANLKKSLRAADIFALIFLIVVILSTATSEWVYEAFWGNAARLQGGFLLTWYVIGYLLISRFYVPKRYHADLMIAVGVFCSAWGILDYFGHSPFGIADIQPFSSTFGNVNCVTAAEAMFLAAASVLFTGEVQDEKKAHIRSVLYLAAIVIIFMGLECGRSANTLVSIGFIVCFIPFFAFRNKEGIVRYFIMLAAYISAMLIVAWISFTFPEITNPYWGELAIMANGHVKQLLVLFVLLIAAAVALSQIFKKTASKLTADMKKKDAFLVSPSDKGLSRKLRMTWAVFGIIAFCGVVFLFYDANAGGHAERYASVSSFLVFNDSWGHNRGFAWKLAAKYFKDFPLTKKLIGSGPETYSIYVLIHDFNTTMREFDFTFDSIHSEPLQRLFETGILGFLSYYLMTAFACADGLRAKSAGIKTAGAAFAFAALTYTLQSIVNISVPIVLPMAIMSIAAASAAGRIED